jgi:hypothetical protein
MPSACRSEGYNLNSARTHTHTSGKYFKSCTGPCPVPFEDIVDAQGHAQCLLQQAINLNSARTRAHQVDSFKRCTGPCTVTFEDLVDAQGHVQCLLQHAINLNNAHTCTSGK